MQHLGDFCGSTMLGCKEATDLLTFISNAILKSGKHIFGMRKPSKFNVLVWNERAKELNAKYREAVSHWNIAGRPRSGPLAEWTITLYISPVKKKG